MNTNDQMIRWASTYTELTWARKLQKMASIPHST